MHWRLGFLIISILTATPLVRAETIWIEVNGSSEREDPIWSCPSHDQNATRVTLDLKGFYRDKTKEGTEEFDRLNFERGGRGVEYGAPEVPFVTRLVAIPADRDVQIHIVDVRTVTLPGYRLFPYQERERDEKEAPPEIVVQDAVYTQNSSYPDFWAKRGDPALLRGLRVIPLSIFPIRYNPATGELTVATHITLELVYQGSNVLNNPRPGRVKLPAAFGEIASHTVVNFPFLDETDVTSTPGTLFIACPNQQEIVSNIAPLIEWKEKRGYKVELHTYASSTSEYTIKNDALDSYQNSDPPLEALMIIGDEAGSVMINSFDVPGWWFFTTASDYPYAELEGSDFLADIAVGRLSVSSALELATVVSKTVNYESNPYIANPNWFTRALCVGGSGSGFSVVITKRWVKDMMLEHGYAQVDTMWYTMPGSLTTAITNALNQGTTLFNYRGFAGMSGWSNYYTDQLTNGFKLTVVTTLTCDTGTFEGSGSCLTEGFLRSGTPANPRGAVAAIGTADIATHTKYNNCIDMGIYWGFFAEELHLLGDALNRGKLELYLSYPTDPGNAENFSNWNNLMGDPTLDVWTAFPQPLTVTHDTQIPIGQNALEVTVMDASSNPVDSAVVVLRKESDFASVLLTDGEGKAILPVNGVSAGEGTLTVTQHNCYPYDGTVTFSNASVVVGVQSFTVSDDSLGESSGDGDGIINPGESIEVAVALKNFGTSQGATGVTATARTDDPYVVMMDTSETYGVIAPGTQVTSGDDFDFSVSPDCPDDHEITLELSINSVQGSWEGIIQLPVSGAAWRVGAFIFAGADSTLSPGETATLTFGLQNVGSKTAPDVTITLSTEDPFLNVLDAGGSFGSLEPGAFSVNSSDPFQLAADATTPQGYQAPIILHLSQSNGLMTDVEAEITVGVISATSVQGPDEYGYFCLDNTDPSTLAPAYNWIEVDPGYGGSGISLQFTDNGEDQDQARLIPLPFTFTYYGEDFDSTVVCSNGWAAFDDNPSLVFGRNWPIPSGLGPSAMLAPFWDDLEMQGGNVYTYHDAAGGRFIIEWSRVQNLSGSLRETFEIVLYDPAMHPTRTGDGEILFQYSETNPVPGNGWDNDWMTIGIESPDQTTGLEITYWNIYDPAAAVLANRRAYLFTTDYAGPFDLTMTPVGGPIVIPPGGDSFEAAIHLENLTGAPVNFDLWVKAILPNGNYYGPVLGPLNFTVPYNPNINATINQNVPGGAPAGIYTYISYVGNYNTVIVDSSWFNFEKTGVGYGILDEWTVSGPFWDQEPLVSAPPSSELPAIYAVNGVYPNPFNPITRISYSLPEPAKVSLNVYDVSGRLVSTLTEGWRDAGTHEVTFDGSELASGVYVYWVTAGAWKFSGKMLLIK